MGTHPIFESDFDCLTECNRCRKHFQRSNWEQFEHCPYKQFDHFIQLRTYRVDVEITSVFVKRRAEPFQENGLGEALAAVCPKSTGIATVLTMARESTRRRENAWPCFNKSLISQPVSKIYPCSGCWTKCRIRRKNVCKMKKESRSGKRACINVVMSLAFAK